MRDEYWLFFALAFVVIASILLIGLPVLSLILGAIFGFVAIALGFATEEYNPLGQAFIDIGKFFWHHWVIMLIFAVILSLILVKALLVLKRKK